MEKKPQVTLDKLLDSRSNCLVFTLETKGEFDVTSRVTFKRPYSTHRFNCFEPKTTISCVNTVFWYSLQQKYRLLPRICLLEHF